MVLCTPMCKATTLLPPPLREEYNYYLNFICNYVLSSSSSCQVMLLCFHPTIVLEHTILTTLLGGLFSKNGPFAAKGVGWRGCCKKGVGWRGCCKKGVELRAKRQKGVGLWSVDILKSPTQQVSTGNFCGFRCFYCTRK